MSGRTSLHASALELWYGDRRVVANLSLDLPDGRITTIIGPNACGKSTLLRSLARLLKPRAGGVYLDGQTIQRMPSKEVARRIGLLSQQSNAPEGLTVEDLVRRGRYPHQGFLQPPTRADHDAVERAIELAGVASLRYRDVDELSGGQRQRAWIAMALAQDTPLLLLDEPTTYLDIAHQLDVLGLMHRLNRDEGRTVVMVLHDVNEAAAISDRIVAMRDGAIVADGHPSDVLRPALLRQTFGVSCDVLTHPVERRPVSVPRGVAVPARTDETAGAAIGTAGLDIGYGNHVVARDLSVLFPEARITVIVGPNACGKSTLLRAVGRLLEPRSGTITLRGRDIRLFKPGALARSVAALPQGPVPPQGIVVEDLVAAGRYPYQRWYRQWSREDERASNGALAATGIDDLRLRPVEELSGGQRQRAFVAMALARESDVMLLDEPTTFLDIAHQVEVLDLVRAANRQRGATVVMVLHDLALACRYADHLVAMNEGRVIACGPPSEIVTPELIRDVFGVPACVVPDPEGTGVLVLPSYGSSPDEVSGDRPGSAGGPEERLPTARSQQSIAGKIAS